jgi:Tol biopolymer transport system component
MHARLRYRYALFGLLALAVFLAGCAQAVREDRTITWASDGGSVGFQHGREGIFLAEKDGSNLTRIYQPDASVIATSTPLWDPAGKRVVFTTARSANGQAVPNLPLTPRGEDDPAGNVHFRQGIIYTCWLYEKDANAKPLALFEASADHPGYVAANLAVRWHPRLERIEYVKQVSVGQHGLFEYDLATKQSKHVFPHTGEAILFDWTPDGSHLVCVLGNNQKRSTDGIWIGQPAQGDWWHVPYSGELAEGQLGSLLERLRSTRPAWTADGSRFAFPSHVPAATPGQPGRHFLRHATLATRTVEVWAEGDRPFRDLVWDRTGTRLGVVRGGEGGSLHLVGQGQPLSPAINRTPVRHFAGWSADGDRLAYIVPDELPLEKGTHWALLLAPDPLARDKVYVAPGEATEPGQPVFSGMRVTFPQWSPREEKLSLWVTFMPAYRSVLSEWLGWGLRPGDPAAVFDLKSGQLAWMPVNAQEKVQVGHYYSLKRDYARAWKWYEEAERELPPPAPAEVSNLTDQLLALRGPRDFSLFEYHCLTKLGRAEEAQAKLDQFRRCFLPRLVDPAGGQAAQGGNAGGGRLRELLAPNSFTWSLLYDLYAAEVFASLDAAEDGEAFFRAALEQATTDAVRASRAIVLGQILLLRNEDREYAELTTKTIAPMLLRMRSPAPAGNQGDFLDPNSLIGFVAEFALVPLGAPEFLARLSDKQLRALRLQWEKLQEKGTPSSKPLVDYVLRGLYQALGQEKERQAAAERLKNRPAGSTFLPLDDEMGKQIVTMQQRILGGFRWR